MRFLAYSSICWLGKMAKDILIDLDVKIVSPEANLKATKWIKTLLERQGAHTMMMVVFLDIADPLMVTILQLVFGVPLLAIHPGRVPNAAYPPPQMYRQRKSASKWF